MKNSGTGSPVWSHDGSRIAFDARVDGVPRIYWMPATGGQPSALTAPPNRSVVPTWSADDKWVYFTSDRNAEPQISRVSAQSGPPEQITSKGGFAPLASPDGKFLYYGANRSKLTDLRSFNLETKEEVTIASSVTWRNYFPVAGKVYYISGTATGEQRLHVLDRTSGMDRVLYEFKKPVAGGIAVSADERSLFFAQIEHGGSDLFLVENFSR